MQRLIELKFLRHPELRKRLIATQDALLEEGNNWGDREWGIDIQTRNGNNHLGQILMKIRSSFADKEVSL